jgi:putative aldouronate transport system substrate-binding protein
MKKLTVILAILLFFSLSGFASGGQGDKDDGGADTGALFSEPVHISLFKSENPSWPFREDWYIVDLIKRKTNVILDVTVTNPGYAEKLAVVVASGDIPDIMASIGISTGMRYGNEGAFIDVIEHEKEMPDFAKWRRENAQKLLPFLSGEGKMFVYPLIELGKTEREGYFYRKDIFEKHNIKEPTDSEEFYQVCKKLKELYPDTYPFTFRDWDMYRLNLYAPQFGAEFDYYYDEKSDSWKYGAIEEKCKDMVVFLNRLYKDGLLTPDFLSIGTKAWVDQLSASRAFITFDWLTRIDFYNVPLRKENPEFTMYYMPPWKGLPNGEQKVGNTTFLGSGLAVGSTTDQLDVVKKYMDWTFTDEARELLSWGEEGVTYEMVSGKKKFMHVSEVNELWREYGIMDNGFCTRFDVDANISLSSPELAYGLTVGYKWDKEPRTVVNFLPEEQEIVSITGEAINAHKLEQIAKFIIGERNISEWNEYAKEIEDFGLDKMLDLYEKGYERLKKFMN